MYPKVSLHICYSFLDDSSHLGLVLLAMNFTSLPLRRSPYICGYAKPSLLQRAEHLNNITSLLEREHWVSLVFS